ncbi:hypothetical protein [Salinarimonas soli]|uniref:Uncharacterized protein n=1 Tax=Salinarimonas soli TaxID=1638099 RepID=A0A5B2VFW3_9HYPH|nr:hypothetical protein [Salinarimonas soli]KAA2237199.1 hypothetical protein F0L46_09290 [Salinarimonas soli]
MITLKTLSVLRAALLADAAASGATGLLALAGAGLLAGPLGLPAPLLQGAGLILLPYAAFVAWLGTRAVPARGLVLAVVAINVLWTLDSLALLASGWVAPSALGIAFVGLQALVVGGFAAAQAYGLHLEGRGASGALRGA